MILIVVSSLSFSIKTFASTDGEYIDGPYTYELNENKEAIIIEYDISKDSNYPNVVLPDSFNIVTTSSAATIVEIADNAFYSKDIESVKLPNSLKRIGSNSFNRNELTTIAFPNSLENIGSYGFRSCKLRSIDFGTGLITIGQGAFWNNELESLKFPAKLENIGRYGFRDNKLVSIELPDDLKVIPDSSFQNNMLTSIVLPSKLEEIDTEAFENNQLEAVTIPPNVLEINESAFENNNIKTLIFTGDLNHITYYAFRNNLIESVEFPNSVGNIYKEAFANNPLTSITLPKEIYRIGEGAFLNNKLKSVTLPFTRLSIGENAFLSDTMPTVELPSPRLGYRMTCGMYESGSIDLIRYLNTNVVPGVTEIETVIPDYAKRYYMDYRKIILRGEVNINVDNQYNDKLVADTSDVINSTYVDIYDPTGTIVEVPNVGKYMFQWYRDYKKIDGATAMEYQLTKDDIGCYVYVRVTSDVELGGIGSNGIPKVTKADNPVALVLASTAFEQSYNYLSISPVEGYEYLLVANGATTASGTWQDSTEFESLDESTSYDIYQRIKETDVYFASQISTPLTMTTRSKKRKSNRKNDNSSTATTVKANTIIEFKELVKESIIKIESTIETDVKGRSYSKSLISDSRIVNEMKLIKENGTVVVETDESVDYSEVVLSLNAVDQMKKKKMFLEIKSKTGRYILPSESVENSNFEVFGNNINHSQLQLKLRIKEGAVESVELAEIKATEEGIRLLSTPVAFELEASYNGKTIIIKEMGQFVTRMIPLVKTIDASKVATGIVIDEDGSFRPIPTRLIEENGDIYAVLNSVTNSLYTIVENQVTCEKIVGHWAEKEILEAINGLVIPVEIIENYNPNDMISRADFTKLLAKTLGLKKVKGTQFNDIEKVMNNGYIYAAYNYGLISGTSEERFSPSDNLTREQAVMILYNVLKLTDGKSTESIDGISMYEDINLISTYAKESMNWAVRESLISGKTPSLLEPKDQMTCAEGVVLINRLMKNLNLK